MVNYGQVVTNIREDFKGYVENAGLKAIVIGISGGIDSAIVAALIKPVCDELAIPVIGRFISIESNAQEEIDRGNLIGDAFCSDFREVDMSHEYHVLCNGDAINGEGDLDDDRSNKIRLGNVKARMRMITLYNLAQRHGGMVMSTDNFTELMVGFWTLHGDVGDYGPIQNMWKGEVYNMSKWLAENECDEKDAIALMACVDATPTDGLGITNSDLDQLGAGSYHEVDMILQTHFKNTEMYTNHPVIKRHYATTFKRSNPYNIPHETLVDGIA